MTAPLFVDRDPCGCERALGHVCRPPFANGDGWPEQVTLSGELQARNPYDKGDNEISVPATAQTIRGRGPCIGGTT